MATSRNVPREGPRGFSIFINNLDDTKNVLTVSEDDPNLARISNMLKNKIQIQNELRRTGILG